MNAVPETYEFQAEARQVLDLMIHSIYSNRDIFLRELISNSSDALDRLRFEAISSPELIPEGTELQINIERDREARTLTVRDNGIGMSRDEVIQLIGTIAKSGTREFAAKLREARESGTPTELIGQFGVGFYSSFMVADEVTLVTRRAGESTGTRWHSTGEGSYTIEEVYDAPQGTSVTLHLKPAGEDDGLPDYLEDWKIREIVKRYSDFVAYPIRMKVERTEIPRDDEGKPIEGAEPKTTVQEETLNTMKAIWLRDEKEVTQEDLNEFYKHIAHDWSEPLRVIRATIEGVLMYRMLLFIPSRAPFDLNSMYDRRGVRLYVKRVFIMEDCEALLPEYLRFVRGVVDSEDLSLNISREILQQNRQIERMRKGITGKVLDALKQMRDQDYDKYLTFWREFGQILKEGPLQDADHRDELPDLFLFDSSFSDSEVVSLKDYVSRMKEGQDTIYYITGESREVVQSSPHLEAFRDKGYEVLYLTDRVDELWPQYVTEYDGKKLQSIGKGAIDLDEPDKKEEAGEERKKKQEAHASVLGFLKNTLDEHVKEVRLSSRLTTSAACLVTDTNDMTPQLEQILKSANQPVPPTKRILEINPDHPILTKIQALYDANPEDTRLKDYAELLYGQAVLAEGGQPPHPARFSKLVADLMVTAM